MQGEILRAKRTEIFIADYSHFYILHYSHFESDSGCFRHQYWTFKFSLGHLIRLRGKLFLGEGEFHGPPLYETPDNPRYDTKTRQLFNQGVPCRVTAFIITWLLSVLASGVASFRGGGDFVLSMIISEWPEYIGWPHFRGPDGRVHC